MNQLELPQFQLQASSTPSPAILSSVSPMPGPRQTGTIRLYNTHPEVLFHRPGVNPKKCNRGLGCRRTAYAALPSQLRWPKRDFEPSLRIWAFRKGEYSNLCSGIIKLVRTEVSRTQDAIRADATAGGPGRILGHKGTHSTWCFGLGDASHIGTAVGSMQ